jgi:hypothetical protein
VTVEYLRDGGHLIPQHVHTVLISAQHSPDISHKEVQQELMKHVIEPVIPQQFLTEKTEYYLNPSHRCVTAAAAAAVCRCCEPGCEVGHSTCELQAGKQRYAGLCYALLHSNGLWLIILTVALSMR